MKTRAPNRRDNFIWLLIALIFLLFNDALFSQLESIQAGRLNNIVLMLVLFVAVWTMEENRGSWLNWKIAMSAVIFGLMLGDIVIENELFAFLQLAGGAFFLCVTLVLAWRQVMFVGTVDTNKVVGAICIYIMIGIIWAFAYLIVEHLFPGSMRGLESNSWQENIEKITYYSMVTLTTLGYGDITPTQPIAQFLAYMEAVAGIFYTTVLVASLIGMQLARQRAEST